MMILTVDMNSSCALTATNRPLLRMPLRRISVDPTDFLKFPPLFSFRQPISAPTTIITTSFSASASKSFIKTIKLTENDHIKNHTFQSCNHIVSSLNRSLQKTIIDSLKNSANKETTLSEVEHFHAQAIKTGLEQTLPVCTIVLDCYVKCRRLDCAHRLFDDIPLRDVRTWTILIVGFARMGFFDVALELFSQMQTEGVLPNCFTFASVYKCCAGVNDIKTGKKIHGWILRHEIGLDVVLENSKIDFYAKCGVFDYARRVFDKMAERDSVSWNIMIGAYLQIGDIDRSMELFRRSPFRDVASWNTIIAGQMQNGFNKMALDLLYKMGEIEPKFNQFTYAMALVLVATLGLSELGGQIHSQILRRGFESDTFVMNSLLDMYCKCGKMESASSIFNKMPCSSKNIQNFALSNDMLMTNTISWSSMISGYVQNGRCEDALKLFCKMLCEGFDVDPFTLTSIASACADAGILDQGRQIHACIEKCGHKFDVYLASAIVDMYSKCGSVTDARAIFDRTSDQSVVLWTSIISGCALNGQGREAIELFELMLKENIRPNEITFVGVLSACSHAGLVEKGHAYFRSMQDDHGIVPGVEHFTCVVDLLGRAGFLHQAKNFIHTSGISHLGVVWRALLSACRVHNNIEIGEWASKQLVQLEPLSSGSYILLSNICSTAKRWAEAAEVRNLMQERGVRKYPGLSWIQLKNKVHTFIMGDGSHPQAVEIYSYLEILIGRLKAIGYSTETNLVMHDVEEEQKEVLLSFHSEKLAIAYGLMSSPCGSPIRVMKNLRVCTDCHTAIKYMSQITDREIVLRDAHRFHHFKHGQCSCKDYW
ncbi:putative pentatricopeptide repeat-containing protein At3g23330 [Tasmannia lanceolata]|uniref:putative pentatricopeptide repeat-containing protein At3g23330 n=1 Tax=Tasmannia lanceolata TaxID=3420 RepID=UPI004063EAFA